jgi:arsenate reductase
MPTQILILCTGNSARSQMAEGLLRHIAGARMAVYSAGSKPSVVNPLAIEAMHARGIDISGQRSKHLNEYLRQPFDYVITVCDNAAETCPIFPGPAQRVHWSFPDPAAATGSHAEQLAAFTRVRDDLEAALHEWVAHLSG